MGSMHSMTASCPPCNRLRAQSCLPAQRCTRATPGCLMGAVPPPTFPLPHQINYCEEQVECRRVLMLAHFGEHSFTKVKAGGGVWSFWSC